MSPAATTEIGTPIVTQPRPLCPECGAGMFLRLPKPGGIIFDPFWGCSTFPTCRGSRDINVHTGEPVDSDDPEEFFEMPAGRGTGYGREGRIETITNEGGFLQGWRCTVCKATWRQYRPDKHKKGCPVSKDAAGPDEQDPITGGDIEEPE